MCIATGCHLDQHEVAAESRFLLKVVPTGTQSLNLSPTMLAGLRQTVRIRQRYLTSALQQEISFFDTQATTGDLLQGLNELSNTIQSGIGEKAGNTIHHLATFAAGFAIGEIHKKDRHHQANLIKSSSLVLLACTLMAIFTWPGG